MIAESATACEVGIDAELHDLGIRNVVIPRKGRPTKPSKPGNDNRRSVGT
jgi:hypothetical protein